SERLTPFGGRRVSQGSVKRALPFPHQSGTPAHAPFRGEGAGREEPLHRGPIMNTSRQAQMSCNLLGEMPFRHCTDNLLYHLTFLEDQKRWYASDAVLHGGMRIRINIHFDYL